METEWGTAVPVDLIVVDAPHPAGILENGGQGSVREAVEVATVFPLHPF